MVTQQQIDLEPLLNQSGTWTLYSNHLTSDNQRKQPPLPFVMVTAFVTQSVCIVTNINVVQFGDLIIINYF